MCFNVLIFHFYILPFFSEQTIYFFISWKTMIIDTHLYLLYFYLMFPCFYFLFFLVYFLYFFIFNYVFTILLLVFLLLFIVVILFSPISAGNSFNSRAGLEFKEFRLFSTIIFQKNCWTSMFFCPNIIVEKANPLECFKKNIELQYFFWKIIVEKNRNSLNSRPALEFKEFPRKNKFKKITY